MEYKNLYLRERLIKQLFVGKVIEIIGLEKAIDLLKLSTTEIDKGLKK
jgi:hypothetical protein